MPCFGITTYRVWLGIVMERYPIIVGVYVVVSVYDSLLESVFECVWVFGFNGEDVISVIFLFSLY